MPDYALMNQCLYEGKAKEVGEMTIAGNFGRNQMNARPHPGPHPQEREKHSPRFDDADSLGCPAVFFLKNKETEMTQSISEPPKDADTRSLSSGERARVRASNLLTKNFAD